MQLCNRSTRGAGGRMQCGGGGRRTAARTTTTMTTFARSKQAAESAAASSSTTSTSTTSTSANNLSRRNSLLSAAASAMLTTSTFSTSVQLASPLPALAADAAAVGTYLPASSSVEGFSHYVPSPSETPAIRAGVIKADASRGFYSFDLPSTWRPQKMANVLTGNFCMPRCDEPWQECVFAGEEGSVKVVVSPLRRLTNKAFVKITDVGPPAAIISSLGSFVTGNQPPEEEEVLTSGKVEGSSGPMYTYEVNAPYGLTGPHHLVAVTTREDLAYLFVVSATEKQWSKAKGKLEKVAGSFQA